MSTPRGRASTGARVKRFTAEQFQPPPIPGESLTEPETPPNPTMPLSKGSLVPPPPKDEAATKPRKAPARKPPKARTPVTTEPAAEPQEETLDLATLFGSGGATPGPWSALSATVDPLHAMTGETRSQLRVTLPRQVAELASAVRGHWAQANHDWAIQHGGLPGIMAFREGLMRLGLAHIDDPELFTLIHVDGRRTGTITARPQLPDFEKATAGSVPQLPYGLDLHVKDRKVESGRFPPSLFRYMTQVSVEWSFAHPDWIALHGGHPGAASWREGLLRLGLKHINDPQLASLIPTPR